ncbi:VOC family protein [uncultured Reyranella sp.]|jgi:catechol 2,3-dioxygenase-like lactoylglutathione lyase family enzyme|uniref:VOC family protein n=1 Tax=uncultured Reyranella sp. TaxID=735512 RepID=UPI00259D0A08|nr:VOC family protein [uncultured Reyranella sp.]
MNIHRGRLIDHLHLKVNDLDASKRFYKAALAALEIPLVEGDGHFFADELWVDVGPAIAHVHFAFQAKDRAMVDRFHAAVLAAGGRDNGAPGERRYHPGYYAAFALDPDGNNVEAVYHGPHERSAASVRIAS